MEEINFEAWVLLRAREWGLAQGTLVTREEEISLTLSTASVVIEEHQERSHWQALQVLACGLCGTDVASYHGFLPFSFPMVIGHELVVSDLEGKNRFLVEINASHASQHLTARNHCGWCQQPSIGGISKADIHCPARRTVGIDRIVGGLSPYVLLPQGNLIPIPPSCTLSSSLLCLCEPLAAAIQAISTTSFQPNDQVAVLGPRRLGMLLIAAFSAMRSECLRDDQDNPLATCTLAALHRHEDLLQMGIALGADQAIDTRKKTDQELDFDIVFDCTGTQSGFEVAAKRARREVHLKSTCGSDCFGCKEWTAFVVDELSLFGWTESSRCPWNEFHFSPSETTSDTLPSMANTPRIVHVYCSPTVSEQCGKALEEIRQSCSGFQIMIHSEEPMAAMERMIALGSTPPQSWGSPFPRYDMALISSLQELDQIIRPDPVGHVGIGLVRSRMPIILCPTDTPARIDTLSLLEQRLLDGLGIRTSRCGSLDRALSLLSGNPTLALHLEKHLITHYFNFSQVPEAIQTAQSKECTKAICQMRPGALVE